MFSAGSPHIHDSIYSSLFGTFLAAMLMFYRGDKFGRRRALILGSLFYLAGGCLILVTRCCCCCSVTECWSHTGFGETTGLVLFGSWSVRYGQRDLHVCVPYLCG